MHYLPKYQQARKGFIYFTTHLQFLNFNARIVPAYLVCFFCVSRYGIVNQLLIYPVYKGNELIPSRRMDATT